jgi:hypothetical protein
MKPEPHCIFHKVAGIGIRERVNANGSITVEIDGLCDDIEPERYCALQCLLAIWKYGLFPEKEEGATTEKLERVDKNIKRIFDDFMK